MPASITKIFSLKTLALVITCSLLASLAHAAFDLSPYKLTEKQRELMQYLESRGYGEEKLATFARALEKSNHEQTAPQIPAHAPGDLEAVTKWAAGAAYRLNASYVGMQFDFHRYMSDCPNLAIFNFGRATGTTYLNHDVLREFANTSFALDRAMLKGPAAFREIYLAMARNSGFDVYLSEAPEKTQAP